MKENHQRLKLISIIQVIEEQTMQKRGGAMRFFCTKTAYNRDEEWMASPRRQQEMLKIITGHVDNINSKNILDFGGGDGRLVSGITSNIKAVLTSLRPLLYLILGKFIKSQIYTRFLGI